ncbi:ABC transporter permease [Nonomuraea sp. K274]|uniref:ABC transporter permease n=1 Tax=Nonomuraea cypriaca TaxID=1187855 RepID=A0A931EVI9_9ACTN|nr:ABC transporter permease [Nonomuraea cypriaca]MBF8184220.1 ABC transporter permease [Nonomuraea cypriaca]
MTTTATTRTSVRSRLLHDRLGLVSMAILLVLILAAVFGPMLSPYDPNSQEHDLLLPPSGAHLMGTDSLGRDVFSRVLNGTRVSVAVGIGVALIGGIVGTVLGLLAGFFRGWIDDVISRLVEVQWAFPELIAALVIVSILGNGFGNVILAISITYVDDFARLVRGETLRLRDSEFVTAARVIGMRKTPMLAREVLPNAFGPIIVQATSAVGAGILGEAALSFLGLGVAADTPTWGLILSDSRDFFHSAWWLAVFPGLCIMITVLGTNLFGRALQRSFGTSEAL